MALLLNYFPFLLLTFLALTQGRNTQFFNKIPATNNNLDPPNYTPQDPTFFPDGFGLYSHVSGQEQESKLKSEPEQLLPASTTSDPSIPTPTNFLPNNYNPVAHLIKPDANSYYNGGLSSFGDRPEGLRQQGMSDTRFLENGKYFYDIGADRYSSNHPYERLRSRNDYINEMSYYFNGNGRCDTYGNQNKDEFQGQEIDTSP